MMSPFWPIVPHAPTIYTEIPSLIVRHRLTRFSLFRFKVVTTRKCHSDFQAFELSTQAAKPYGSLEFWLLRRLSGRFVFMYFIPPQRLQTASFNRDRVSRKAGLVVFPDLESFWCWDVSLLDFFFFFFWKSFFKADMLIESLTTHNGRVPIQSVHAWKAGNLRLMMSPQVCNSICVKVAGGGRDKRKSRIHVWKARTFLTVTKRINIVPAKMVFRFNSLPVQLAYVVYLHMSKVDGCVLQEVDHEAHFVLLQQLLIHIREFFYRLPPHHKSNTQTKLPHAKCTFFIFSLRPSMFPSVPSCFSCFVLKSCHAFFLFVSFPSACVSPALDRSQLRWVFIVLVFLSPKRVYCSFHRSHSLRFIEDCNVVFRALGFCLSSPTEIFFLFLFIINRHHPPKKCIWVLP